MVRLLSVLHSLKTNQKSALAAAFWLWFALPGIAADAPVFRGPVMAGQLAEPKNEETSGLAVSHRTPGLLWTHNDSGGEPVLFALNADGSLRGKLRIEGVKNFDWEEIGSFVLDGKAWLIVGDIGDNYATRPGCVLHVIPEPDAAALSPDEEVPARPAYSIPFIYEDGARDAEALAVEVKERVIYILSKRDAVPRLYRLPLAAPVAGQPVTAARFVGPVGHLPQPTLLQRSIRLPTHAFVGWPTAMGFSHDGALAFVLVYEQLLLFPRAEGESWAEALAREPFKLPPHQLPQAEAACFSTDDRSIFVGSEKTTRLLRYDRP